MKAIPSLPVYVGLFFSLLLAVTCNAYLDIEYGFFKMEVLVWTILFAATGWIGWRHRNAEATKQPPPGARARNVVLVLALLAFVFIFLPVWPLSRATIYLLAAMQAANNCVPLTRRHLYLAAVLSITQTLFASAHLRADWTLMFYVIPFVFALLYTLIAEQISSRSASIKETSVYQSTLAGQGIAVASAATLIFILALLLHAITPQVTWQTMHWRYGLPVSGPTAEQAPGGNGNLSLTASQGMAAGETHEGLTPAGMRAAAKRTGMPGWQSNLIYILADRLEDLSNIKQPLSTWSKQTVVLLQELLEKIKTLLLAHALLLITLLALLIAAVIFFCEIRPVLWLRTRIDYLIHGLLVHSADRRKVQTLYRATERLLKLHGVHRPSVLNSNEYMQRVVSIIPHISPEIKQMTRAFEQVRYGPVSGSIPFNKPVTSAREAYRQLFRILAQ